MKTDGWCYICIPIACFEKNCLENQAILTCSCSQFDAFPKPHDLGAMLPPTLYIYFHIATTGCSKDPWGLLVPLEVS